MKRKKHKSEMVDIDALMANAFLRRPQVAVAMQEEVKICPKLLKNIQKQFKHATPEEIIVIVDILSLCVESKRDLEEFFKGGHLVIEDDGELYNKWNTFTRKTDRNNSSSHDSIDKQFSIQGPLVKECLIGTRMVGDKKATWIQLESHPTSVLHVIGHLVSFLKYKLTGKNQGPYGQSKYTEKKPCIIENNAFEKSKGHKRERVKARINEFFNLELKGHVNHRFSHHVGHHRAKAAA